MKPRSLLVTGAAIKRNKLLLQATSELLAANDMETMLGRMVKLLVPTLGDWCMVNLVSAEQGIVRVADARRLSPEKNAALDEIRRTFPLHLSAAYGVSYAIRTGKSQLVHGLTDEQWRSISADPRYFELWKKVGIVSFLAVPIKVGETIYGGIGLDSVTPGRLFRPADLKLVQEIAGFIGLSLERTLLIKQATDANQQKDEFLRTLSHELKTPLSVIIGWSQLLARQLHDPRFDAIEAVNIIERNALLQKDLVENIIDASLAATQRLRLEWESIDLLACLRSVIDSAQHLAAAKRLDLRFDSQESSAYVLGDPLRLRQVFSNLLSNAIKFTPPQGSILVILAQTTSGFLISMKDTGIGIKPEFLPRVFNRFSQADSSMRRSTGGLGLGLALARHIISLHGGKISAMSEGLGRGTSVNVELPAKPPRL